MRTVPAQTNKTPQGIDALDVDTMLRCSVTMGNRAIAEDDPLKAQLATYYATLAIFARIDALARGFGQ